MLTIKVSETAAQAALEALSFASQSGYIANGIADALRAALAGVEEIGPLRFTNSDLRGKTRTTVERDGKAIGRIAWMRDSGTNRKRYRFVELKRGGRIFETTNLETLKQRIFDFYDADDLI